MIANVAALPRRIERITARAGKLMFKAQAFDGRALPDWLQLELQACALQMEHALKPGPRCRVKKLPHYIERTWRHAIKLMLEAYPIARRGEHLDLALRQKIWDCAQEMKEIIKILAPERKKALF